MKTINNPEAPAGSLVREVFRPRPLTPDEMERVADVLSMGPLTKRAGDDEFIERGLFALYEDDANAVEGAGGAVEAFYDYSPGASIRGAVRPEWRKAEPGGHAPGPWVISSEFDNRRDEVEAADGRTVAVVWTRRGHPGATARAEFKNDPELLANARIIAAAPDLLAALILAREALEHSTSPSCFNPHRVAVREAIRKATGNNRA